MSRAKTTILALLLTATAFLSSCGTVTPPVARASVASFDGGKQNSGVLGANLNPDGSIASLRITANARNRYNSLVAKYGGQFLPPLKLDDGITPGAISGEFALDAQHVADFAEMNSVV